MLGEFHQPQRLGVPDQLAEDAVPLGEGTDGLTLLPRHAHRQELCEPGFLTDRSQSPVLGVHHHNRGLDDPTQHLGQIKASAHRHDGIQQQGRLDRSPHHGVEPFLEITRQRAQPTMRLSAVAGSPVSVLAHRASSRDSRSASGHTFHGSSLTVGAPTGPAEGRRTVQGRIFSFVSAGERKASACARPVRQSCSPRRRPPVVRSEAVA
ncbi:hypothetical protein GA0115234_106835 [Streptomyces sp. DvalAA-43]|nr:hypothetical protein GA0115234_106835 [Streptomyces sp. DvalAA-43]